MSDFKVNFGFAQGGNPPEPQTPVKPSRPAPGGTIEFLCKPAVIGHNPRP